MKKNFTFLKNALMLICSLLFVQFSIAQRTTIAGWSFPTAPGSSVSTYSADCGNGTIYLDGTHGASTWAISGSSSQNNSATFYQSGYRIPETIITCNDNTNGKSLALIGQGCNGFSASFCFSTTNLQDITMSYDCRLTSRAYRTVVWSYSVDGGETWVDETTIEYDNTATDTIHHFLDFTSVEAMNNAESVILRITGTGAAADNGSYRLDNILISGASNVPTTNQPIFSVTQGNYCAPVDVTMTCATENASIYYTIDGSNPDNVTGTLYTEPIHIETTTMLRAIAYAEGLAASFETSAQYTFPSAISTIAEFKALNGDGNYYKLSCPLTAVFQNGSYLFVEDEAHTGLCIYGNVGANFVNGDVITGGVCGTNTVYNSMIEISNPVLVNSTPTQGTPVEPVSVSMAQLRINWNTYDSRLVTVNGVTFEQGTVGTYASNYLKIYQNGDSLGCANTFGAIPGFTAPVGMANVTGITINNTLKRIAPRNTSDIVDLQPSINIVSPTEGQIIEQGTPVKVNVDITNFNFENECVIEGKLLINGEPVTTQYLTSAAQLAIFENMDLSSMMTSFGEYTVIMSLVNADHTQFAVPATDTVHFTYRDIYVAIETSESALAFSATGESRTFAVTGFRLDEAIALTVSNSAFTVSPATLPANSENDTVTVTFTGTESATGTLTLTSGTTTATVALSATLPIDEVILSVGFEASEGFSTSITYNNDNLAYFGPEGQKWGTIHGAVTTTDAMVGQQSMQMRYYGSTASSNTHLGHLGYAYTNFDVHNVTKVEFDAKSTGNLRLRASFSHDGGATFEGDSVFVPSSSSQRFTYFITDSGEYYSVRVKFAVELPDPEPTNTFRLTIDAVDFYGITGLEPNIVETPVISESSGNYLNPFTTSISCSTEGASIYYTTDGTTPDESSTLYESPITINSTCTLKAKAFKGGMDPSNVAFAEYSFPVEVATIADFKTAGANDNSVTYKITGNVTFVYRQARRIFIEDTTGGLLVYDNSNPVVTGSYNEGDVISGGIVGTYTVYNGMQELVPTADWSASSSTAEVTPTVVTAADITGDFATYEARLVRVNGGTFAEEASFNTSDYTEYVLSDESGEIIVRNQFKTVDTTVNAGDTVDVIGLVAIYVTGGNTTYQLFPRTNADIIPVVTEPADTTNPEDTVSIHTLDFVNLTVYPNPTTTEITVTSDRDGGSLEILNAFGQVVYRNTKPVYPMTVNMSDKASGLYFVRVITADRRIAVVKLSKE